MQALLTIGDKLLFKSDDGNGIKQAQWNGQTLAALNPAILPVTKPKQGNAFANGLPSSDDRVFQANVIAPARTDANGNLMVAVAVFSPSVVPSSDVYGLFADKAGILTGWQYLATVPAVAWSIASYDGSQVFLGATDSKILLLAGDGSIATKDDALR